MLAVSLLLAMYPCGHIYDTQITSKLYNIVPVWSSTLLIPYVSGIQSQRTLLEHAPFMLCLNMEPIYSSRVGADTPLHKINDLVGPWAHQRHTRYQIVVF